MPHAAIEDSANRDGRAAVQGLCDATHTVALTTGSLAPGAMRVRATRCDRYAIADKLPDNTFADIVLWLGRGRNKRKSNRKDFCRQRQGF